MSRNISQEHVDAILKKFKDFSLGARLTDLLVSLHLPRRSLQRYLSYLVKEGNLCISGKGRATKYFLTYKMTASSISNHPLMVRETPEVVPEKEKTISLSYAALSIQSAVRQPIQMRRQVGYNGAFLKKYIPNKTYYLSEDIRNHLFEVGKSPDGERPAGTYARQILDRLLIDLSWNSSRLEGNTYSLLETERLLELGETTENKDTREAQMILNHKAAIEFLVESADQIGFDQYSILNLHALLADNLLLDERACGALRAQPVGIAKSVYKPLAMPQLISEYFDEILKKASAIKDPFEQSFFIMVQLPYLQPFLDVNKRVSRLAANIPFIRENLSPLSFVDVPEQVYVSGLLGVYELNRIELLRDLFVWAYERSSGVYLETRQVLGEPDRFRMRYRELIIALMGEIIRRCMNKQEAVKAIKQKANENVVQEERAKFIEVSEKQLMSLHRGNIARFKIKPKEYDEWLKTWR